MPRKVFVVRAHEDWIVDRLADEWYKNNSDITTCDFWESTDVWLLANWCYNRIDRKLLQNRNVITTIHHIVPDKFDGHKKSEFLDRDYITSLYHVPNKHTEEFVRTLTNKPIRVIPYWANQDLWKKTGTKESLRQKYALPQDDFLIGSFQRDTEGHDLKSPKLEKGPDLFVDFVKQFKKINSKKVHVVLAGWRREYVVNELTKMSIPFTYLERPEVKVINDLYQTLDLYAVSSRYEGGPQALIECGLLSIPVVSRDVGLASQVLIGDSINDDLIKCIPSVPRIDHLRLPAGMKKFRELFLDDIK